jgi:hypothetical protein
MIQRQEIEANVRFAEAVAETELRRSRIENHLRFELSAAEMARRAHL